MNYLVLLYVVMRYIKFFEAIAVFSLMISADMSAKTSY